MTDIKDLFDWVWDESRLAEASDWVTVVEIGGGGGYDWTDFHSWYSPSERRYFWGWGSGCLCNSFTDDYTSVADFENGDRAALMAGIRRFAEEYEYAVRPTELVDALTRANSFDPRTIKAVSRVMTEVAEVKTIGDVERIVHGSGLWDGTTPVEFSNDGTSVGWMQAWSPTDQHPHPQFARVSVYRKDVRLPATVTIRWDEQRPRENEEWAAKWDAAPTRHFGRTARMVAFRQTFRDILGDVSIEDEERTTGPAPEPEAPARDWAAEITAAATVDELDTIDKAARAVKAFTPDAQGTALHRQLRAKRKAFTEAAWEPAVEKPAPRTPQDHLPGNRASRRAKKKRGRR